MGEPTNPRHGFEPDSLREQLRLLAVDQPALLTPAEEAYLRHYGIHFTEEYAGLRHWFGAVDADPHRIAAHLWLPEHARGTAVVIQGRGAQSVVTTPAPVPAPMPMPPVTPR